MSSQDKAGPSTSSAKHSTDFIPISTDYDDLEKWPPGGGLTGPLDPNSNKYDKCYNTSKVVAK